MDNHESNMYEHEECSKLRDNIYSILDICRLYTHNRQFKRILVSQLNWLGRISDADFYHPQNKERVTILKNFLEQPEEHIPHYVTSNFVQINAYIYTKEALIAKSKKDPAFRFANMQEVYAYSMNDLFTEIVAELEFILTRVPPMDYEKMKENKRQFYQDLNKYILKPERIEKMAGEYRINCIEYLDAIFGNDE